MECTKFGSQKPKQKRERSKNSRSLFREISSKNAVQNRPKEISIQFILLSNSLNYREKQ